MKECNLHFLTLLTCSHVISLRHACPQGHEFHNRGTGLALCAACGDTMNFTCEDRHSYMRCQNSTQIEHPDSVVVVTECNCTKIEHPDLLLLVTECNRSHDDVVPCHNWYCSRSSRNIQEKDRCGLCREGECPSCACQEYHDSLFCSERQDSFMIQMDVVVCKNGSVLWRKCANATTDRTACLPCHEDTFQTAGNHTDITYWTFTALSMNQQTHAAITGLCTSNATSQTVFSFSVAFCKNCTDDQLVGELECKLCQKFTEEARPCGMFQCTICDGSDYSDKRRDGELSQPVGDHSQFSQELLFSAEGNSSLCYSRWYLPTNSSNRFWICKLCENRSCDHNARTLCKECTPLLDTQDLFKWLTNKKKHENVDTDIRISSVLLFSLALLIDIMYVLLYSRHFIRRNYLISSRGWSSQVQENTSRLIGTFGIDLHVVLVCVHFFGALCEIDVVQMDRNFMWTYTVVVGLVSIVVYFIDAVLFLVVKRLLCAHVCMFDGSRSVSNVVGYNSQDTQVFLDST